MRFEGWNLIRLKLTMNQVQNGICEDEPKGTDDIICVRVADFDRTAFRVNLEKPAVPKLWRGGAALDSGGKSGATAE